MGAEEPVRFFAPGVSIGWDQVKKGTTVPDFTLTIPGEPVPWNSTKQNRKTGNRFLPGRQSEAISHNVAFINDALGGDDHGLLFGVGVPLELTCRFYLKRPKGHYGTGRNATTVKDSSPRFPTGKPDRSNLEKMVEDCLVLARVMPDDDQIIEGRSVKRYAKHDEQPRTVFCLREFS